MPCHAVPHEAVSRAVRHVLCCVLCCVRYAVLRMGTMLCVLCCGMGRSVSHALCCVLVVLCSAVCRAVWHATCRVLSHMMPPAVNCAVSCDVPRQSAVLHALGILNAALGGRSHGHSTWKTRQQMQPGASL